MITNIIAFVFEKRRRSRKLRLTTVVDKLRVFENRVLRRILGPQRDRVTGGWRKLHNEELHNL
jgi:hypothetical protein